MICLVFIKERNACGLRWNNGVGSLSGYSFQVLYVFFYYSMYLYFYNLIYDYSHCEILCFSFV